MTNHLQNETSPYLLQHAENPVDWYPWGEAAFAKARSEDKPVFLSIGYSTCHWCHVMARESFEDAEIAAILNDNFVSVKVDKEQRPDIDSVYMAVCQAFSGSGGWPTSIFLTPEQQPFFAGTYFPPRASRGMLGFRELLLAIAEQWRLDRPELLRSAAALLDAIQPRRSAAAPGQRGLIEQALRHFRRNFDANNGGFGGAPKFPCPHNLLFLLGCYDKYRDEQALNMAEQTLRRMYAGGLFDHIGYGFCRYSTDRYFLVPHFEKMLYDNALLIMTYSRAFELTGQPFYLQAAEQTADYILREMTAPEGGFYSAQDADSEGQEGAYYLFDPAEIVSVLGPEQGRAFNARYDITERGNFEGRSIPNLLHSDDSSADLSACLPPLREYRLKRYTLRRDEKILTAWNGLMIAALSRLYRVSRRPQYLQAALAAQRFMERQLLDEQGLRVSFYQGRVSGRGFLDDYAAAIFGLLELYHASLDKSLLESAQSLLDRAIDSFFDQQEGGFYLYSSAGEQLILRPKDSYDGAIPSGNSLLTLALLRMSRLLEDETLQRTLNLQLKFMCSEAQQYPAGQTMFLTALLEQADPPPLLTVAVKEEQDLAELPFILPSDALLRLVGPADQNYPLQDGRNTYYLCQGRSCRPPVTELDALKQALSEK